MQFIFVILLKTRLAYVIGSPVIRIRIVFFEPVFIRLVDTPDVAQKMRRFIGIRIVTEQARLDFDTRKAILLCGKTCHLLVGEATAYHQRFKIVALRLKLLEALAISGLYIYQFGQVIDGGRQIRDLARRDFQRVAGKIVRQHHTVAIQYQAAAGYHGHD